MSIGSTHDGEAPDPGTVECRMIFRTPDGLSLVGIQRCVMSANRVLAALIEHQLGDAGSGDAQPEEFPADYRENLLDALLRPKPLGGDEAPSGLHAASGSPVDSYSLASSFPVVRLSYPSPLEVVLAAPEQHAGLAAEVFLTLPTIIRRYSRLRTHLAQDRSERNTFELRRERLRTALEQPEQAPERILVHQLVTSMGFRELETLEDIERVVVEVGGKTHDSQEPGES